METAVLMERKLFDCSIKQNSKTGMFCVNDLLIAGNHWRAINKMPSFNFSSWLQTQSTIRHNRAMYKPQSLELGLSLTLNQ